MKQRTRDKLIKSLALILSLGTLWLTLGNFTLATTEEGTLSERDKPSTLNLSSTVKPTGTYGEWGISLTIEGRDYPTTTDVVMVVDNSGGVSYRMARWSLGQSSSKLDYVKTTDNKVIVILDDGMPTYCYEMSDSNGISIDHNTHTPIFENDYSLTYNTQTIIDLRNITLDDNMYVLKYSACGKNNAITPTLYEANTIKSEEIEAYSIAFSADNSFVSNAFKPIEVSA